MSRKRRRPQGQQQVHPIEYCKDGVLCLQLLTGEIARLSLFKPENFQEIYLDLFSQAYCYLLDIGLAIGISPDAISKAQDAAIKELANAQQQQEEHHEETHTPT